ncbi:MAG: oligosaccharide flippase family protein [Elusimicrobiota bacterium]
MQTKKDVKKSGFDYAALVSSRILKIIIAVISVPIITRILGPEGYGRLNLFYMIGSLGMTFLISWLVMPTVRFGKEEFVKTGRLNKVFWSLNLMMVLGLLIGVVVYLIFRNKINSYIGIEDGKVIIYLIIYFLLIALSEYMNRIFIATGKIDKSAVLEVLPKALLLIPLIYFFIKGKVEVLTLIILALTTQGLALIISTKWFKAKLIRPLKIDTGLTKNMFIFAYPFFFSATASYIVQYIDLIVIKKYMPVADVGIYSLSYNIAAHLKQLVAAASIVMTPIIIGLYAEKRKDLLKDYVRIFIPQGIFLWSVVLCGFLIAIPFIMPVFFEESFSRSIIPVQILLCGLLVNGIRGFYSGILTAFKLSKIIMVVIIVIAFVNLLGDVVLVPLIGINGAALSSAIAFSIGGVGYMYFGGQSLQLKEFKALAFILPVIFVYIIMVNGLYYALPFVIIIYYFMLRALKIFKKGDVYILNFIKLPDNLDKLFRWIYNKLGV